MLEKFDKTIEKRLKNFIKSRKEYEQIENRYS